MKPCFALPLASRKKLSPTGWLPARSKGYLRALVLLWISIGIRDRKFAYMCIHFDVIVRPSSPSSILALQLVCSNCPKQTIVILENKLPPRRWLAIDRLIFVSNFATSPAGLTCGFLMSELQLSSDTINHTACTGMNFWIKC